MGELAVRGELIAHVRPAALAIMQPVPGAALDRCEDRSVAAAQTPTTHPVQPDHSAVLSNCCNKQLLQHTDPSHPICLSSLLLSDWQHNPMAGAMAASVWGGLRLRSK